MNVEEILEEAGRDYKPLSGKVNLTINELNENETLLTVTFHVSIEAKVTDLSYMDPSDHTTYYAFHVKNLLSEIEKNLLKILPSLNIRPPGDSHEGEANVRIDSHIPDDVVLMSPETYHNIQRKAPGFIDSLRRP